MILGVWGQPPGDNLEIFRSLLYHGAHLHMMCFSYSICHVLGPALPLLISLIFPSKTHFITMHDF